MLAYVLGYSLVLAFYHSPARSAVLDWMNVPAPLIVMFVCAFVATKARTRPMIYFWGLLAFGSLCNVIAEATWALYAQVLHVDIPYPSLADAAWVSYYPVVFAALLTIAFAGGKRRLPGMSAALDGFMFAFVGLGLGWEFLMRPAIDPTANFAMNAVNLAYPVGDLLLIAGLISMLVGPARLRSFRGVWWLCASLFITFVADVLYARMSAAGTYESGDWIDILWPLGYALAGMSALAYLVGERRGRTVADKAEAPTAQAETTDASPLRRLLPYIAVLSVAFLAYYHFVVNGGGSAAEDAVVVGVCVALPILVLVRQAMVMWDNLKLHASLARLYEDTRQLAERDPVTGLLNHRSIGTRLEEEVARSERTGSSFAVVMMDIDNFKLFNDTYGHVVGDQVLLSASRLIKEAVRIEDIVGRFGGDEFVAILPNSDAKTAEIVVDRIRQRLADNSFLTQDGSNLPLFMSYGVAGYPSQGRHSSQLLAAADSNLYRSKQRGGDCITTPHTIDARNGMSEGGFTALDGLVNTVDNKDHYTRKHSDDVTSLAVALAAKLGLSHETQSALRVAGLLHDVGKIGIVDSVLRKPGPLTDEEYEAVKQHVGLGELIIKEIPNLSEVLAAVGGHHERYDGTGYPRRLKGEDIPLLARILAVTDAYSAMTTDRPYRKAFSREQAKSEMRRVSGTQLDPKMVEAFLSLLSAEGAHETRREALGPALAATTGGI